MDALVETRKLQDLRPVIGQAGEVYATKYLQLQGYKIIFRNYRCRTGEIDIIATKDDVLTFVEVKTRYSLHTGRPVESVTFTKQQKIRRTAQYFLQANGLLENMPILSFDVIEIVLHADKIVMFNHFQHAF